MGIMLWGDLLKECDKILDFYGGAFKCEHSENSEHSVSHFIENLSLVSKFHYVGLQKGNPIELVEHYMQN